MVGAAAAKKIPRIQRDPDKRGNFAELLRQASDAVIADIDPGHIPSQSLLPRRRGKQDEAYRAIRRVRV
jgi:hypothetical protein